MLRKPGRPPKEREPVPTFSEFFYARFPHIPPGQFGTHGEPNTEILSRFMATASDYLNHTRPK